ncbi:MAG TPA: hypothetical protein VN723_02120 [Rhizomicrobium sp.]|jgi:hypothetical protein|nr:hypothetical protein [Rhizomicrobium sp.]
MTGGLEIADRLSRREARALACALRKAGSVPAAIRDAKRVNGGRLAGEHLWQQIADEIAIMETAPPTLQQRLRLAAGAVIMFALTALYFVRMRLQ